MMYGIFPILKLNFISLKIVWLPLIFFLDSNNPCLDLLLRLVIKRTKISLFYHALLLRNPCFSDHTQICRMHVQSVAKEGTMLKAFIIAMWTMGRGVSNLIIITNLWRTKTEAKE